MKQTIESAIILLCSLMLLLSCAKQKSNSNINSTYVFDGGKSGIITLIFTNDGKVTLLPPGVTKPPPQPNGIYKVDGKNVVATFGTKTFEADFRMEDKRLVTISGMFPSGLEFKQQR